VVFTPGCTGGYSNAALSEPDKERNCSSSGGATEQIKKGGLLTLIFSKNEQIAEIKFSINYLS
jgi:hypothetical protein